MVSPGKILVFVISGSNLFRNRPGNVLLFPHMREDLLSRYVHVCECVALDEIGLCGASESAVDELFSIVKGVTIIHFRT